MNCIKFNFEDLKVYQKAIEFIDFTYKITRQFPKEERFGLISQFNRAAVSIALNISEGSSNTDRQFNRYLQISIGSLHECVVCSTIANRQGYISKNTEFEIRTQLEELSKMLFSLKKKMILD